jgi:DNA-binding beta-propeller fold protein YncE
VRVRRQANPHRPGISPALHLRTGSDDLLMIPQTGFATTVNNWRGISRLWSAAGKCPISTTAGRKKGGWKMKNRMWLLLGMLVALLGLRATLARAQDYEVRVVATGLNAPTGLTVSGLGDSDNLYFTEVPQAAAQGVGAKGANTVSKLTLSTSTVTVMNRCDPQPTSIVQDAQGNLYWTSPEPGVIMMQSPSGNAAMLLWGLDHPVGVTVDAAGENLYYTELPTPGVLGWNGGQNKVWQFNLTTQFATLLNPIDPSPTDIVVTKKGDLYFTCQAFGIIVHMPAGVPWLQRNYWTGFHQPLGLALDPTEENLYFTEVPTPGVDGAHGGQNTVSKFNLATATTTVVHAGDPQPTSVAVTPNGTIYWTDTTAGAIMQAKAKAGN